MKLKLLTVALLVSNLLCADTIFGIYAGAQTWYYDLSGDINAFGNNHAFADDFDDNKQYSNSFYVAIEHPLPFVPNVKIKRTDFDKVNQPNVICPATVPNFCSFDTSIDLSHTDFTFYYELLDNWVNLDLGVSVINFSGQSTFDLSGEAPIVENYSKYVPALYGKALFEVPITNLSVSLTANVGTLTNNSIIDVEASAQYKFALGFSIEAGLRQQTIDFKDFSQIQVHSEATGVFAALNFHF